MRVLELGAIPKRLSSWRCCWGLAALALLVPFMAVSPAQATDKCGAVCDETWNAAGSPYVVTCNVTVGAACTLGIDAGVEVRFQPATGIEVWGTLDVNGASGNEALFTSDAGSPAAGDWGGSCCGPAGRRRSITRC